MSDIVLGGGITWKNKIQSVPLRTYCENRPITARVQCNDCDKYNEQAWGPLWESMEQASNPRGEGLCGRGDHMAEP